MKGLRFRTLSAVSAMLLVIHIALGSSIAHAGIQDIKGDITDPRGVVINNARVTDGVRSSYTGTSGQPAGRYLIEESTPGTYSVSVTKSGFNPPPSQSVDPLRALTDVDFTMTYSLSGTISPKAFRNDPAQLVTITATSIVPTTGTCVSFVDSATGGESALSYNATNAKWEGSYQMPGTTTDGTYGWTLKATDCASGVVLSNTYSSTYIVDTVAPLIVPQSLTPHAGGNTVFANQPLLAKVIDRRAGVDVSTINFDLRDESTGTTTHYPAQSWSASSWWAKSSPASLTAGHLYTLAVSVSDNAGNEAEYSQNRSSPTRGFLATSFSATTADASIPHADCGLSDIGLDGLKTVTCNNVQLVVGNSSVTMSGTKSWAEKGYVVHTASLTSASIKSSTLNQSVAAFSASTNKAATLPFDVTQAQYSSQTFSVTGTTVNLGTVTKKVPATFTDAWIEMLGSPAIQTVASPQACVDPSAAAYGIRAPHCSPDPVGSRYLAVFKFGTDAATADSLAQSAGLTGLSGEDKGVVEGPVSAAQALFNEVGSVASVQRMGGDDVVDSWGELQNGVCITRSLRIHSQYLGEGAPRDFDIGFVAPPDGSCGLTGETVQAGPCLSCDFPQPPRPSACDGAQSSVWSGSDTLSDPIDCCDLSWQRAFHRAEWNSDCTEVKWTQGAMHVRSGSGPCWWQADRPIMNRVTWEWDNVVEADYETDSRSREDPSWDANCNVPPIPPKWPGQGMDCDANLWTVAFAKPEVITSATLDTIVRAPEGRGGACHWLHNTSEEEMGSSGNWYGDAEDKCIALTPQGAVNEDDTNWCV